MAFGETISVLNSIGSALAVRFAGVLKERYLQRREIHLVSLLSFLENPANPVRDELFLYLKFEEMVEVGLKLHTRYFLIHKV